MSNYRRKMWEKLIELGPFTWLVKNLQKLIHVLFRKIKKC